MLRTERIVARPLVLRKYGGFPSGFRKYGGPRAGMGRNQSAGGGVETLNDIRARFQGA